MQITAGSLAGAFGRNARYWGERMLEEGFVHLLATDAHDQSRRPPNLSQGRELAAKRVGNAEAEHLVLTRPRGILLNDEPSNVPMPDAVSAFSEGAEDAVQMRAAKKERRLHSRSDHDASSVGFVDRLRRLFQGGE